MARGDRVEPVGPGARPVRHGLAQRDARQDAQDARGRGRQGRRGVLLPAQPRRELRLPQAEAGLFLQIGDRYGIDLKGIPTCGDSLRDLQAGAAAGCEPHLLLTGMGAACRGVDPLPSEYPANTMVHDDLAAFVDFLLAREARDALQVAV
ncbi:hypothetical protein GmRootV15_06260 [Variovorax sp. V15]